MTFLFGAFFGSRRSRLLCLRQRLTGVAHTNVEHQRLAVAFASGRSCAGGSGTWMRIFDSAPNFQFFFYKRRIRINSNRALPLAGLR